MGKQFAGIEAEHRAFIERQKIFFVASAPPNGRINVFLESLNICGAVDCSIAIPPVGRPDLVNGSPILIDGDSHRHIVNDKFANCFHTQVSESDRASRLDGL